MTPIWWYLVLLLVPIFGQGASVHQDRSIKQIKQIFIYFFLLGPNPMPIVPRRTHFWDLPWYGCLSYAVAAQYKGLVINDFSRQNHYFGGRGGYFNNPRLTVVNVSPISD